LRQQGRTTLLPLFLPPLGKTLQALFPTYLFCQLNEIGQWWTIKNAIGCITPIMHGQKPAIVPLNLIDDMFRVCDSTGEVKITAPIFTIGQHLLVGAGPFADHIGKFISYTPHERVRLLLHMLGQEVVAEVEAKILRSIPA
jgi:transcription antitermination factor NusG